MILAFAISTVVMQVVILGFIIWVGTRAGKAWVAQIMDGHLDRYEDRVHQQSLAEARRLLDSNRQHPPRPDAGPSARVYRARIRRNK